MGGLGMLAGMMPGMKKAKAAMAQSGMDDKVLVHMDAIIGSMTPKERAAPELLNAKRKIRVAEGVGHRRAGRQQAAEDAPGNGPRDEADPQDGRAQGLGAAVRRRRHGRAVVRMGGGGSGRRHCRASAAGSSRLTWQDLLKKK